MNRKDFGKLVAALRQDLEWTQFQLAENSDLDIAVISQIERGVKKTLAPEMLVKIADALQLTTLECKEFLLAANGFGFEDIVRQTSAGVTTDTARPDLVLERQVRLLERMRVPAFLLDGYFDTLAANLLAFAFFQISAEKRGKMEGIPGEFNIIRLAFGKNNPMLEHFADHWDAYALNTVYAFRKNTLRYRAQPYFRYLIKTFRDTGEFPLFNHYWQLATSEDTDQRRNFQRYKYQHLTFGQVEYVVSSFSSITRHGELILIQYLAANENTRIIFDRLASKVGQHALRLSPWPVKRMP